MEKVHVDHSGRKDGKTSVLANRIIGLEYISMNAYLICFCKKSIIRKFAWWNRKILMVNHLLWNCLLVSISQFIRGIVQRGVSSACAIWKKIHCFPLVNLIGFFNMPSTQTSLAPYYVKMGDMSTTSDQRIDAANQKLIGWANLSNILSMICTLDFYISNTEYDQQLEDLHCWMKSLGKANVVWLKCIMVYQNSNFSYFTVFSQKL